ncbi:MAG: hypothetical protein ACQEXJ_09015 [Myxococcota bacterium]
MTWTVRFTAPAFDDPEVDVGHEPPPGHTGRIPAGIAFAAHLVDTLRRAGWDVQNRWATDYSHAFDVRIGRDRFDVMVLPPEGQHRRWVITLERRRGLVERFVGRREDTPSLRNLCRGVHDALAATPEVGDVRWFDDESWEGVDAEGGEPEPPPAPPE